ncbi:MAG: transporter substrate-binding domain-containing protein [Lachnospiraceae bacterium]|nr:transporter substrate-binding domain-containing protein [Lachnospiraceae bacterium]
MKTKWYKFGAVVFLLILTLVSAVLWKTGDGQKELKTVTCADDLEGSRIGGVRSYMGPEASGIYFESLLGRDTSAYREYDSFEDAVEGLRTGEVDAIWACDSTADYAVKNYGDLDILDNSDMSATARLSKPRFSFALAVTDDKEGEETRKRLSDAIDKIRSDGTLGRLVNDYIKNAVSTDPFREEDMWSRTDRFRFTHEMSGSLDIGITGSAPPIEMIDEDGQPSGFCVAMLDEIACRLCTDINIRILDTETAYSQLMAGKIDALFAGADSGNTTQEDKKFLTTTGYLDMYNYKFLVRTPQEPETTDGTEE